MQVPSSPISPDLPDTIVAAIADGDQPVATVGAALADGHPSVDTVGAGSSPHSWPNLVRSREAIRQLRFDALRGNLRNSVCVWSAADLRRALQAGEIAPDDLVVLVGVPCAAIGYPIAKTDLVLPCRVCLDLVGVEDADGAAAAIEYAVAKGRVGVLALETLVAHGRVHIACHAGRFRSATFAFLLFAKIVGPTVSLRDLIPLMAPEPRSMLRFLCHGPSDRGVRFLVTAELYRARSLHRLLSAGAPWGGSPEDGYWLAWKGVEVEVSPDGQHMPGYVVAMPDWPAIKAFGDRTRRALKSASGKSNSPGAWVYHTMFGKIAPAWSRPPLPSVARRKPPKSATKTGGRAHHRHRSRSRSRSPKRA